MKLVIVESPAKCSKIQGFLGDGWKVLASMGHIRKLVEDLKALHIEDGFNPEYEFMKEKVKTISELKMAAREATKVYLASDDDREGEAIAHSVALALGLNTTTNPRIVFHEITKTAVLTAIENSRTINMNRVNSQQARAVLDLMVGFTISPLLWRFVGPALSAGRCQTPALRIIVEREKEIENFKSISSFEVKGLWTNGSVRFTGKMIDLLESEEDAKNYLENVHMYDSATITSIVTKPTRQNPPLPLITSSLQQEASANYSSNPKLTMKVAQKLYETGYITYMRTDSVAMSEEATKEAKTEVIKQYGEKYLGTIIQKSKSDNKTQDAHECIRPTRFSTITLDQTFSVLEKNIYNLIYKRAIQSIMAASIGDERKVQWIIDEDDNKFIHESTWKRITFQGWKIVGQSEANLDEKEEEETHAWESSEKLSVKEKIKWLTLCAEEKFTSPLNRYNEATLVRELEKRGIGRPSTFASLVASIIDKNYIEIKTELPREIELRKLLLNSPLVWPYKLEVQKKKVNGQKQKMFPTNLGVQVYDFCVREFKELFDYTFTKHMEDRLDLVENGSDNWQKICTDTYNSYKTKYETLKKVPAKEISNSKKIVLSDGYEAVITKNGPCLVKNKEFLGWPKNTEFKSINDSIVQKFLEEKDKPDIFGYHEGEPLIRKKGKFGEYVVYDDKNISLKPGDTVETVIEKLSKKSDTLHSLGEFVFKNGPYGTYMMKKVTPKGKKPVFVSIPSGLDVKSLTEEAAKKIYETNSKPKRFFKNKEKK
jgi:DNA topoisomerase-1